MSRPRIGLTIQLHPGTPEVKRGRPFYYLAAEYATRVREAGGVPLFLAPGAEELEVLDGLDGLLFSGGEDVAPHRYGEQPIPELGEVDEGRDAQELPLVKAAIARRLPVFAICRGLQVLNVAMGGTLYQDLKAQRPDTDSHRQEELYATAHRVTPVPGTRLAELTGTEPYVVNTFHHEAIKDLAPGWVASATSPDGVIEAAELPGAWVLGVQWHPELLDTPETDRLFRAFVAACAGRTLPQPR